MVQLPIVPAQKSWRGQWWLGRGNNRAPAGWRTVSSRSGWTLAVEGSVPVQPLTDAGGRLIGYVAGQPIDLDARTFVTGGVQLRWAVGVEGLDAAIAAGLYRLGGAWMCLLDTAAAQRLYHDAGGVQSAVFDPATQIAASSTGLLLADADYAERFDGGLYQRLDIGGEGWIPSGLTAHRGVVRLLANHHLDLATFQPVRHWPEVPVASATSTENVAADVTGIVRATVAAALSHGKVAVALTGGSETRLLLAALKPLVGDLTFVTLAGPGTERDVAIASHLAERFGLQHRLLPILEASLVEQDRWLYAAGHCVTGQNMRIHPSIRPLQDEFAWFVGGVGGELARAFFWRTSDTPDTPLTGESLTPRFGMPAAGALVDATSQWLDGLAGFDTFTQLDLAYLELRTSAWTGSQTYSQCFVNHLYPLIGRDANELLMSLSPEAKRANHLLGAVVAQSWPELANVPVNRYGDIRDTLYLLHKATNAKKVAKKLRKLFG